MRLLGGLLHRGQIPEDLDHALVLLVLLALEIVDAGFDVAQLGENDSVLFSILGIILFSVTTSGNLTAISKQDSAQYMGSSTIQFRSVGGYFNPLTKDANGNEIDAVYKWVAWG